MSRLSHSASPIPPWMLLGVLLVCGLVTYCLLPGDGLLLERQLRDGYTDRALQTLQQMSAKERSQNPAYYAALELTLLRQWIDIQKTEQVNELLLSACQAYEQFGFGEEFRQQLLALVGLGSSAQQTFNLMEPYLVRMPLSAQQAVYGTLVTNALAAGDPSTAARIYSGYEESAPPTATTVTELVRLWRFAQKPDLALVALDRFASRMSKRLSDISPALARLRIDLLREVGEPGEAFEAIHELAALSPQPVRDELFDVLVATAFESNRATKALPEVQRQAAAHPNEPRLWQLLAELAVAAGDTELTLQAHERLVALEGEDSRHLLKLARLCEGNNRPGLAFDYYLKLLPKEEPTALDRLFALNPGLYRDFDLAQALWAVRDSVHKSGRGLDLARLQRKVGHFETAKESYERLIEEAPASFDLHLEYAHLLSDLFEYERALAMFTRAEQLNPGSPAALKAIAECLYRTGDYEASLARYRQFVAATPDERVLESYVFLATSLGRKEDLIRGLKQKLKLSKPTNPDDYLSLAACYQLERDTQQVIETVRAGLALFPRNRDLLLAAVNGFSAQHNYSDAARVLLAHPDLRTDLDIAQWHLELLVDAQEYHQAQSFLASGLDPAILAEPQLMEIRAFVYEMCNDPKASAALCRELYERDRRVVRHAMNYARVLSNAGETKDAETVMRPFLDQPNAEVLRLVAEVHASGGDYAKAEAYYRRSLEAGGKAQSPDWRFLGDILAARGDKAKSQEAYRHALKETLKRINR